MPTIAMQRPRRAMTARPQVQICGWAVAWPGPGRIRGLPPAGRPADGGRADRLIRLIGAWPSELQDLTETGRRRVVDRLRRALCDERRRGLTHHWAYDLGRHAALLQAYREERAALEQASLSASRRGRGRP